jgi:hypothetical protein
VTAYYHCRLGWQEIGTNDDSTATVEDAQKEAEKKK